MSVQLLLASKRCSECLMGSKRIVQGAAAAKIIESCRESRTHFICHKGSIAGKNLHCRGFHDKYGSQAFTLASVVGIPIVEVDPDELGTT